MSLESFSIAELSHTPDSNGPFYDLRLGLVRDMLRNEKSCVSNLCFKRQQITQLTRRIMESDKNKKLFTYLHHQAPNSHGDYGVSTEEIFTAYVVAILLRKRNNWSSKKVAALCDLPEVEINERPILFMREIETAILNILPASRREYFTRTEFESYEAKFYENKNAQGVILLLHIFDFEVPEDFPFRVPSTGIKNKIRVMGLSTQERELVHYEFFPYTTEEKDIWKESRIFRNQFADGAAHENEIPTFKCRGTKKDCGKHFLPVIITDHSFDDAGKYVYQCGNLSSVTITNDHRSTNEKFAKLRNSIGNVFEAIVTTWNGKVSKKDGYPEIIKDWACKVALHNCTRNHFLVDNCQCNNCTLPVNRDFIVPEGSTVAVSNIEDCFTCTDDTKDTKPALSSYLDNKTRRPIKRPPTENLEVSARPPNVEDIESSIAAEKRRMAEYLKQFPPGREQKLVMPGAKAFVEKILNGEYLSIADFTADAYALASSATVESLPARSQTRPPPREPEDVAALVVPGERHLRPIKERCLL